MCSSLGENWGLSVNEAMNFDLPVIASDLTGCSDDLVTEGANGYVFKTGDVADLTVKLEKVLLGNELSWQPGSKAIIADYSYSTILDNMLSIPELKGELAR
jgi:glycosyltransferase involved in cell wall biosynthesis